MNGKLSKVVIYLGAPHTGRCIYSSLLKILDAIHHKGIDLTQIKFYNCMLSPCYPVVNSLLSALNLNCIDVPKPSKTVYNGIVSSELKSHHLELLLDCDILIVSKDYMYDVYLDSLIKSYKPLVFLVSDEDTTLNNLQMNSIRYEILHGGVK